MDGDNREINTRSHSPLIDFLGIIDVKSSLLFPRVNPGLLMRGVENGTGEIWGP